MFLHLELKISINSSQLIMLVFQILKHCHISQSSQTPVKWTFQPLSSKYYIWRKKSLRDLPGLPQLAEKAWRYLSLFIPVEGAFQHCMCSALWNKTSSSLSSLYQPPIIGGGFPQLLPSGQGLWSSAILVKPLFNIPLKISSSTNSRQSLVQYSKYREYAKWGGGCLLLLLFWSRFSVPTLFLAAATSLH